MIIYSFKGSLNIGWDLLNQEKTLHNYLYLLFVSGMCDIMTHPMGTL